MWTIVVAGGSGRRFGGPKQFLELAGRPVVSWSIMAARAASDGVVLVVPDVPDANGEGDDPLRDESFRELSSAGADRLVTGGATRADSVRSGLAAVPEHAAIIVVHDAVRPLAPPSMFAAVVEAVRSGRADGAIPVLPVSDTLKRISGGMVRSTEDRDGLVLVQTPQAFVAGTLRAAHRSAGDATDDAGLLERLGATVCTVVGDPCNLKLTRPEDLAMAEVFLESAR
ncbi:MAG TPA: 2-C-methyl-D-erythritol 4-phosphate cytidylyltransferase [Acidimicrobiales bacterium]|nr:2-C-methyl-D-erythritol 4-phosphate cytidylyltransferase [Acidimicrobiales bacterium]